MNSKLQLLHIKLQNLLSNEEGQDLIEYALVVALIAFGATAAMSTLGLKISSVFSTITNQLTVV
jgi:pilus assembly protein Flp/PilA